LNSSLGIEQKVQRSAFADCFGPAFSRRDDEAAIVNVVASMDADRESV
jgi:hypothetical protein